MWRVIFSVYMFVALFDIMFFIRTINECARIVKDELIELEDNIHKCPGWENFEIATHFRVKWLQSYRFFIMSLFPIGNIGVMYSFYLSQMCLGSCFIQVLEGWQKMRSSVWWKN